MTKAKPTTKAKPRLTGPVKPPIGWYQAPLPPAQRVNRAREAIFKFTTGHWFAYAATGPASNTSDIHNVVFFESVHGVDKVSGSTMTFTPRPPANKVCGENSNPLARFSYKFNLSANKLKLHFIDIRKGSCHAQVAFMTDYVYTKIPGRSPSSG
jgi:hypothetical protein